MKTMIAKLSGALVGLCLIAAPVRVMAASPSTFSLQQSGNTISVYEASSVTVNTVEADFSYTDSQSAVQSIGVSTGSTFATCINPTSTSIVCSALGGAITGTHLVATLTINLKSTAKTASVTATMQNSSAIYSSVDNTDTLDHNTLPSATYSYTAPAPTPAPTPAPVSTPAPTSSNVTNKSAVAAGQQNTAAAPQTSANDPAATIGNVKGAATTAPKSATITPASKTAAASSRTGFLLLLPALIIVIVGAYYLLIRRNRTAAVATVPARKRLTQKTTAKRAGKAPVTKRSPRKKTKRAHLL